MHGLIVAVGSAAARLPESKLIEMWPITSKSDTIDPLPDVRIVRFMPDTDPSQLFFAWSGDRQFVVAVDGYMYVNGAPQDSSLESQVRTFAEICRKQGFSAGMRAVAGGAFTLAAVDIARGICYVSNDHTGSIPLYHSPLGDGWLISTNPVALARSGIIDTDADQIAMAEWAYIGYTLGDRFMLKGIKLAPLYSVLTWDCKCRSGLVKENDDSPWRTEQGDRQPTVEELNDAFAESCRRISLLDGQPANYQSAGKDSRLILAAWPQGYNPPCYTYGDSDSHEVSIARQIAELRGSQWIHVWEDGDKIAPLMEKLFNATGLIVFPDRLIAARQIQKDGFEGVLDGFFGGIWIGGVYFSCDRYFSLFTRAARFVPRLIDQSVSRIGLERITTALLDAVTENRDDIKKDWLSDDFAATLKDRYTCISQDMYEQVSRWQSGNDSLARLWNRVVNANRNAHAIVQQAVISRIYVDVYMPFSGDVRFLKLQLQVRPERAAYDRLQADMFRRRYPAYADIPYGATLLPLRSSALRGKLSMMVMSKGWSIPGVTGNARGRMRDANSWAKWMAQSRTVGEVALSFLREGGIVDESKAARTLGRIQSGETRYPGRVFHLAAIARWLSMSGKRPGLC